MFSIVSIKYKAVVAFILLFSGEIEEEKLTKEEESKEDVGVVISCPDIAGDDFGPGDDVQERP